ncbi:hypothetical protein PCANB_001934 [Pneumocystis canis]|nr:hypothetical protein PCK1_001716 [Pneumocystis canis]KAG5440364.1 hypothetical protein PCANB_001934 [Pneumocystis canis]
MINFEVLWSIIQSLITIITTFILFQTIIRFISIKKIFYQLKPVSKSAFQAIVVLLFFSLFSFIFNLSFVSENIILKTSSGIQTPESILTTRLNNLRQITEYDKKILQRLKHLNGRLLYVLYGPSALGSCEWCEIETPVTFLYYTIPHVLLYYLVNFGIIRFSTSTLFKKVEKPWGKLASIITFFLFILELILLNTYDWKSNAHISSSLDINWIHWKLKKYRSFLIIILDIFIAFVIWLIDTNVWCLMPTKEEQLIFSINNLKESINRIRALTIIKKVVSRDIFLQEQKMKFYQQEKKRLEELDNDINIKNAENNTISQNETKKFLKEIENYAENLIKYLDMKH